MGFGKYLAGEYVFVSEEKAESLSANKARPNDLVFTQRGTLGQVAIVPDSPWDTYIISQSQMKATIDPQKADVEFLYYYFSSPSEVKYILSNAIQTGVPHTNLTVLKEHPICLPPLPEQRAIAHILGTLDDKIELNRRMNATLEAMAQALFQSWFVDFDPVIDNALAAGHPIPDALQERAAARAALGHRRQPLPAAIQSQFPSRFVRHEEMGWVPEGWEASHVGNEFNVTMGQSPPGDTYNETSDGMPFFQGRADFGFRYPANRVYCTEPKRMASKGDTLVSVRAPVGDVNMALDDCCIGRGVSAVRHKSGSKSFTYYAMLQLREHFKVYEAEGTVFGSINQKDFNGLPQLHIPLNCVILFDKYAGSFDEKIEINTQVINQVTTLRDTLLPKLLSGAVRVAAAI